MNNDSDSCRFQCNNMHLTEKYICSKIKKERSLQSTKYFNKKERQLVVYLIFTGFYYFEYLVQVKTVYLPIEYVSLVN